MYQYLKLFLKLSRQRYLLIGLVLALAVSLGVYLNSVNAATATLLPTSTENNAWTAGTAGCTTATTGHTCVDEGSLGNATDYIGTGTALSDGVTTTFPVADQANVATATSLTLYMYARSVAFNGNTPNADTISMSLDVGGVAAGAASVKTMATSFTWYSVTYSGNWTQSEVNDIKAKFTRNVVGGGNQANADDDVQISSVYVSMTYTSPVVMSQAAYRWFGSEKTRVTGIFDADTEHAVGTNPEGVTTADLNGDSMIDLISANVGTDTISVLMGNGDGTFDPKVDYATSDGPTAIISKDFNGDQDIDIITANVNNGTISVLLGNGDGTFAVKADYTARTAVREIAAGDLDGDQNFDLVVTGIANAGYSVLTGNGDGTFDAAVSTSVSDFRGIALADFNGDQDLDLVAANISTDAVSVLLGNGNGTFAAKVDYPTADGAFEVAIGDFNNDQKVDIVSGTQALTSVSILLGNGDGTFGTKVDYPAGTGSSSLKVADINSDQNVDIVSVINNNADTAVAVLKGVGDGTFGANVNYLVAGDPNSIATSDADGDGGLDLFVTNYGSGTLSVLMNNMDYPVLGAINAGAQVPADGSNFRLRVNIGVSGENLSPGAAFKLRYQAKSGSCSTDPATYADVTTLSAIRFYDNTSLVDHSAYIATDLDPKRSGITAVGQTYDESNNFASTVTVLNGRDGLWDLSLAAAAGLTPGTTYCVMVAKSDNTALNSYAVIPEITIPNSTLEQSNYRFYQNVNDVTLGAPLAAQNTKPAIPVGSDFRLRQLLRQTSEVSSVATTFKLQAAEKITSCSAGAYATLSTTANSGTPASTGYRMPIVATDEGDGVSGWWTNVVEATAEDGIGTYYVFNDSNIPTAPLQATDYGFAIPVQDTITGVEMRYKASYENDMSETGIYLTKDGSSAVGTNMASMSAMSTGVEYVRGNSSNLWGTTLTPTEVNSANFGARFSATYTGLGQDPADIEIDYMSMNIHYLTGATVASFKDNIGPADEAAIGVEGNDPTATSGSIVPQTYTENETASVRTALQTGQNGLWDFSLRADESLVGKTYCFRMAKSDGTALASYAQYPEVTFTAAGPTLSQQMRGGQSVVGGLKRPLNW